MSIYLHQNEQQTGPFSEDQIRQMLQASIIPGSTLAWKEGMAGWEPISSFPLAASLPNPPPPPARGSALGLTSFIIGLVSLPVWFILIAVAGVIHNTGNASPTFNMLLGLVIIFGLLVNFVALLVGGIAAFKSKPNTLSIIGAGVNGFVLVALIGLVWLGLAIKHAS
jgi:hypothetical protein